MQINIKSFWASNPLRQRTYIQTLNDNRMNDKIPNWDKMQHHKVDPNEDAEKLSDAFIGNVKAQFESNKQKLKTPEYYLDEVAKERGKQSFSHAIEDYTAWAIKDIVKEAMLRHSKEACEEQRKNFINNACG